jgi:hypothetical protein
MMPRTDLLDELGLYLIERKNLMHRWTSLREIMEAVKADLEKWPDGYSHLTREEAAAFGEMRPLLIGKTEEPK